MRQVQARALQGHRVRAMRCGGHQVARAPRAHGPHRPGRPRHPHLVLQGRAEPPRLPARHRAEGPGEGHLLRGLHGHQGRRGTAPSGSARPAGRVRHRDRPHGQAPRQRDRGARQEGRSRSARAGGGRRGQRLRQGEAAQQRRARDGGHPPALRRPDPAPERRVRPLQEPEARRHGRRRGPVARDGGPLRRLLRGLHGRRGDPEAPAGLRPRGRVQAAARGDRHRFRPAQGPRAQAPEGRQRLPDHRQQA